MSAISRLKTGERVELAIEGTVKNVTRPYKMATPTAHLLFPEGWRVSFTDVDIKVNTLEPEYVDGGVYKDASGEVYRYVVKAGNQDTPGWESFGSNGYWSFAKPERPLKRIDA